VVGGRHGRLRHPGEHLQVKDSDKKKKKKHITVTTPLREQFSADQEVDRWEYSLLDRQMYSRFPLSKNGRAARITGLQV
jgi:hypothetical protein